MKVTPACPWGSTSGHAGPSCWVGGGVLWWRVPAPLLVAPSPHSSGLSGANATQAAFPGCYKPSPACCLGGVHLFKRDFTMNPSPAHVGGKQDRRNGTELGGILRLFAQRACEELTRLCRISSLANSKEWEEISMRFFNSSYEHMRAQASVEALMSPCPRHEDMSGAVAEAQLDKGIF